MIVAVAACGVDGVATAVTEAVAEVAVAPAVERRRQLLVPASARCRTLNSQPRAEVWLGSGQGTGGVGQAQCRQCKEGACAPS